MVWTRPGSSPIGALSLLHAFSSSGAEFLAVAGGCLRRGGDLSRATGRYGPEFGNLTVDLPLLALEALGALTSAKNSFGSPAE